MKCIVMCGEFLNLFGIVSDDTLSFSGLIITEHSSPRHPVHLSSVTLIIDRQVPSSIINPFCLSLVLSASEGPSGVQKTGTVARSQAHKTGTATEIYITEYRESPLVVPICQPCLPSTLHIKKITHGPV